MNVCPLAVSGVPTIDGLAARLRRQKPWPATNDGRCGGGGIGRRQQAVERWTDTEQRKDSPVTDAMGTRATVLSTCATPESSSCATIWAKAGTSDERQIVRVRRAAVGRCCSRWCKRR